MEAIRSDLASLKLLRTSGSVADIFITPFKQSSHKLLLPPLDQSRRWAG